jgi:hypothetical protein
MGDGARRPSDRPGDRDVPDLDFSFSSQKTKKADSITREAIPDASPAPPSSGPREFDFGDGDDDMVVDRNIVPAPLTLSPEAARSSRVSHGHGSRSGLELGDDLVAHNRLSTRSHAKVEPHTDWAGGIINVALIAAFGGGVGYALLRFVHRPEGWDVASLAQPALDGGSATWSGAAAMIALTSCITLTIMAMFARPRSLGYGLSALGAVVIAVTLMVITFSVGPDGAPEVPPDGAKLVPLALPFVPLGVAFRLVRNGWDECFEGETKTRMQGAILAAASACVAFVAAELAFGAGLSRLF